MKNIVCFGDSNTWGYRPGGGERYTLDQRWTGVLQRHLGSGYRVNEEGLNGRTTCFPDPLSAGRNGFEYLPIVLDTHTPVDLLIIMLGTNDTKTHLGLSPFAIARGAGKLVEAALRHQPAVADILLISPLLIVPTDNSEITHAFDGAIEKSHQLAEHYRYFADKHGCHFLEGALIGSASSVDGIHLDLETHQKLAAAVAEAVVSII